MMKVPEKCLDCEHTIIQLENVHQGWCKYQLESVVRCDCYPVHYKVGCVCAEMYCAKKVGEIIQAYPDNDGGLWYYDKDGKERRVKE